MELGVRPTYSPLRLARDMQTENSIVQRRNQSLGLLSQDGSELRRLVSRRSVGGDITLEWSEQMPKYLDR